MPGAISNTISTTQLARHLAEVIDKVRVQRQPLAITKGRRTVAQLNPPPQHGYPITQLARLLASLPRLGNDATGMTDDLARIRRSSILPESPWAS